MDAYYVGLDGGSTYLKAALMKNRKIIDVAVCSTGINNNGAVGKLLARFCKKEEIGREHIRYIMATGYSRKALDVADDDISEITAHAYGVRVTAPKEYCPGMIIDIIRRVRENSKKESCRHCHGCGRADGKSGVIPMFTAGFIYGCTPCALLLFMMGYAFTQPIAFAAAAGITFGMASMVSPVFLLVVVSGSLSKRMRAEIPGHLKWFRLASYLLLLVMPFVIRI